MTEPHNTAVTHVFEAPQVVVEFEGNELLEVHDGSLGGQTQEAALEVAHAICHALQTDVDLLITTVMVLVLPIGSHRGLAPLVAVFITPCNRFSQQKCHPSFHLYIYPRAANPLLDFTVAKSDFKRRN